MEVPGRVHNGVIVFDETSPLPEGAAVSIVYPASGHAEALTNKQRIELPLIACKQPGSVALTSQRIAEILDAEDAAPRR